MKDERSDDHLFPSSSDSSLSPPPRIRFSQVVADLVATESEVATGSDVATDTPETGDAARICDATDSTVSTESPGVAAQLGQFGQSPEPERADVESSSLMNVLLSHADSLDFLAADAFTFNGAIYAGAAPVDATTFNAAIDAAPLDPSGSSGLEPEDAIAHSVAMLPDCEAGADDIRCSSEQEPLDEQGCVDESFGKAFMDLLDNVPPASPIDEATRAELRKDPAERQRELAERCMAFLKELPAAPSSPSTGATWSWKRPAEAPPQASASAASRCRQSTTTTDEGDFKDFRDVRDDCVQWAAHERCPINFSEMHDIPSSCNDENNIETRTSIARRGGRFYIGATCDPVRRWRGGWTRDNSSFMHGHHKTCKVMHVIAVRRGKKGADLEDLLITKAKESYGFPWCANVAKGGGGFCHDGCTYNLLYICTK